MKYREIIIGAIDGSPSEVEKSFDSAIKREILKRIEEKRAEVGANVLHNNETLNEMKNVTLTQIRKSVESSGGNFKNCKFYLNGNDAYEVNGKVYTKKELIDVYLAGGL